MLKVRLVARQIFLEQFLLVYEAQRLVHRAIANQLVTTPGDRMMDGTRDRIHLTPLLGGEFCGLCHGDWLARPRGIRIQILRGVLQKPHHASINPLMAKVTIQDVARVAGVSVATVDRVLNRRLPVREDTALRVVAAHPRRASASAVARVPTQNHTQFQQ